MRKETKYYLFLFWVVLVFLLLTWPVAPSDSIVFTFYDKIVHFFLFGILAWLFSELIWDVLGKKLIFGLAGLASVLAYSWFGEYLQNFITGRSPSIYDFIFGAAGAAIFLALNYFRPRKPRLLLHICCIGCGGAVMFELKKDYRVDLFFSNPNIFPLAEYQSRRDEVRKISDKFGLELIEDESDYSVWRKIVKGLEKEPEKGARCLLCYHYRLQRTAEYARKKGYDCFTTTLTISPHKSSPIVAAAGLAVAQETGISYLEKDFKVDNGFQKSVQFSKKYKLKRQNYCGCEFSIRKIEKKPR